MSQSDGVRRPIDLYLEAQHTGNGDLLREAFLQTAFIEGYLAGTWISWDFEEYCAKFDGVPAPDEAARTRTVDLIDVTGRAPMVKLTLNHGAVTFTDYMQLVETDSGEWKIANKTFDGVRH
jgi:hypothetical protein